MPSYATVDDAPDRGLDRKLFGRLLKYVRPYRNRVIVAISCNVFLALLMTLRPFITKHALDRYIVPKQLDGLYILCIAYLGILVIQVIMQFGLTYTMAYIGQHIIYDLRVQIFKRAIKMDNAHFDRNPVGEMVTRVTNDVDALNEMFSSGIISVVSDLLLLLFITIAMFWQNWRLACVAFAVLPFLLLVSFFFRIKARSAFRGVRQAIGKLNGFMQEHVVGMSIVQLFARERREEESFNCINNDLRKSHIRTVLYYALYFPTIELLSAITIALILWYGGKQALESAAGLREVQIGEFFMFILFTEMFFHPVYNLSDKYNVLQNAMAAAERIFSLLDNQRDVHTVDGAREITSTRGEIEFRDVHFAYNENEPVIRNLSLKIEPGETVAIVGATGAGKTTLISLLSRFYDVNEGAILLDGTDIRDITLQTLRQQMSVVLQDVTLFPGTVKDNISLEEPSISHDDVVRAAKMVGAHDFISDLSDGYDTVLAEDGSNLSVGQRQLLSFARALAHKPSILVLDEATSNVDTETEHIIQNAISRMLEDRSAIVIAHRLSTIRHSDRIAVMHRGELREFGTHAELMEKQGIYYRLYQLQYKDQEAENNA